MRAAGWAPNSGQYYQAIEAFQGGLTGIFEHDPTLLMGLANAQFARGQHTACRETQD